MQNAKLIFNSAFCILHFTLERISKMEDELNSPLNHSSSGIEIFFRTLENTHP